MIFFHECERPHAQNTDLIFNAHGAFNGNTKRRQEEKVCALEYTAAMKTFSATCKLFLRHFATQKFKSMINIKRRRITN